MKKVLYILIAICALSNLSAQNNNGSKSKEVQDKFTIYTSDKSITTLIFDDELKSGIPGNKNYVFTFSRGNATSMAQLAGFPGADSNLSVITMNGNIYDFKVSYKKNPIRTTYFINDSLAIGNLNGEIINKKEVARKALEIEKALEEEVTLSEPVSIGDYELETVEYSGRNKKSDTLSELYNADKEEYIRKYASNEISLPPFYRRKFVSKNGVYLQLKNYKYNMNELYFTFIIDNENGLDYDVRSLDFYMVSRNKKKSTSSQKILLKPMYVHSKPSRVEGRTKATFVYVFDKFSIAKDKSIFIELLEHKGERNLTLTLDVNTINDPN